jgi:hypothetical protein
MSTYYDSRAARTVAGAEAEATRAAAEATRARTALEIQAARIQLAADREERAEKARKEREASKAVRRKERRVRRRQTRAACGAAARRGAAALKLAVVRRTPTLVGGVAMGSPIAIAWNGQYTFAEKVMHLGLLSPMLPIALEGAVWYLAYLTHRAVKELLPVIRYRLATWCLAGVAAAMNFWHGSTPVLPPKASPAVIAQATRDAMQTGVALALASVLGIALWELTVGLTQHSHSRRSLADMRTALWRRIRYPRLSYAAASIRAARGTACTAEQAWREGWVHRYGLGPEVSRRDRKLSQTILRRRARADREAAKNGELSIVGGVVLGRPIEFTPVHRPPARTPSIEPDVSIERVGGIDSIDRSSQPGGSAFLSIAARSSMAIEGVPSLRSIEKAAGESIGAKAPADRSIAALPPARIPGPMRALPASSRPIQQLVVPAQVESGAARSATASEAESDQSRAAAVPASVLEARSIDRAKTTARVDRSDGSRRSGGQAGVDRGGDGPGPRKSFEEHQQALHEAVRGGRIDPSKATIEDVRRTLKCAPTTARRLHPQLAEGVLA